MYIRKAWRQESRNKQLLSERIKLKEDEDEDEENIVH